MKVTEQSKSSFQLKAINLRKSNFEVLDVEKALDGLGISINIEKKQSKENRRLLECALTISLVIEERVDFNIAVTMIGKFEIIGDVDFDTDEFLSINAPSIIYPYIRQHVRTLSLESGMIKPIILPVLNFVNLHKGNVGHQSDN
ncbi:MAG: protein-export chaperone SecB [Saprospiraceae bacterium]